MDSKGSGTPTESQRHGVGGFRNTASGLETVLFAARFHELPRGHRAEDLNPKTGVLPRCAGFGFRVSMCTLGIKLSGCHQQLLYGRGVWCVV